MVATRSRSFALLALCALASHCHAFSAAPRLGCNGPISQPTRFGDSPASARLVITNLQKRSKINGVTTTSLFSTREQARSRATADITAVASSTASNSTTDDDAFSSQLTMINTMNQESQSLQPEAPTESLLDSILSTYIGPRAMLLVLSAFYATNFPLGAIMNDHLPASASTTARMVLAALALSPAVPKLAQHLRVPAVVCGGFTALGYVTQSLALVDADPARVSFLGAVTVLWCPLLEAVVNKKPMGLREAPQTWLAAVLCLTGVGVLELLSPGAALTTMSVSSGDVLALLQAVGFGTGVFWTSRMVAKNPDQALPVTATLIATTAFLSMLWSVADGWMFSGGDWMSTMAVPGMFLHPSTVAGAVMWTGLVSTSLAFWMELTALGRVSSSEASVLLASEPLWAALFAAAFYGQSLSGADALGGALIVAACLANAVLTPSSFEFLWGPREIDTRDSES